MKTYNTPILDKKLGKTLTFHVLNGNFNVNTNSKTITASIASLLTLKIITEQVGSVVGGEGLTKILEDDIDGNENQTINPAAYWQLAAKFPVPGSYRFGVPREKIKDSLALMLILHAFNKLIYKNFDEVGGDGYRGVEPEVNEAKRNKTKFLPIIVQQY